MSRLLLILLSLTLVLSLFSCQHSAPPHSLVDGSHQLLVTFNHQQSRPWIPGGSGRTYHAGKNWSIPLHLQSQIKQLAKAFQLKEQDGWPISSLNLHCVVFHAGAERNFPELLTRIRNHPGVIGAQPMNEFVVMANQQTPRSSVSSNNVSTNNVPKNNVLKNNTSTNNVSSTNTYNDPHFNLQYGQHGKHIRNLHHYTRGGNVKVAVIDTLADTQHPDLSGQINHQYNYVNGSAMSEHHGTAVAGVISARANNHTGLVGLAPEAGLFMYGACESRQPPSASCNSFNIAKALEQAIEDNVQVLNLSLAGPHDPLLEQLLGVALSKGMIIVAAINPEKTNASFPASLSGVIGVNAAQNGSTSQFRNWLTDAEKLSTQSGGGYQFFYGNSMSAASVSGIAALVLSKTSPRKTEAILNTLITGDCGATQTKLTNEFVQLLYLSMGCYAKTSVAESRPDFIQEL
jgi:subtilisin family serine protease